MSFPSSLSVERLKQTLCCCRAAIPRPSVWLTAFLLPLAATAVEVASLHPLLGDMARKVGGDRVTVIELIGPGDNPHEFQPSPQTLREAEDADLFLASGKGLESAYLEQLEESLDSDQELIELGRRVHSLVAEDGNPAPCCAHHSHTGVIDPHWWHEPDNMRRAARDLADALAEIDPANAAFYHKNAAAYREELSALDDWIQEQVDSIPRDRRILATSHLAFGYFCRKYDFVAVGVQGVNREDSPTPQTLAEIIGFLREEGVPVLFPEVGSNPKALETIAQEARIQLGAPLYADGSGLPGGMGYDGMMRHNVNAIVGALGHAGND